MKKCNSRELFNKGGIEQTRHRELVLNILSESDKAWTAKSVLEEVRKNRTIDKVTLYRILDLFVSKRILRKITSLTGTMAYEVLCDDHRPSHPHLVCRICGEIECLTDVDMDQLNLTINDKMNVEREDIDLKIEGVCSFCEQRKKT